jgi:hypothetical protein
MAGPDFRSGPLVIVVTTDEDNHCSRKNRVLTVVISCADRRAVVRKTLTHYCPGVTTPPSTRAPTSARHLLPRRCERRCALRTS